MIVRVVAYGVARDITGRSFELEVHGTSVGELRKSLIKSYPELAKLSSLMVAVNEAYAGDETPIGPDDEVVLIPPVSGG